MAALPPLASVEVDGLGDVLFCHASPRNDEEIVTPLSPESRIAPMLAGVAQSTVVLGHTHVQFDRAGGAAAGSSTRAASACPTRAGRPRTGPCWVPDVELRSTRYDVTVTCARIRESGIPEAEEYAEGIARPPGAAEASEFFERMATRACPASLRAVSGQTPYSAASQVSRCCLTSARNCAA